MHEDGAGECVEKVDGVECQYICTRVEVWSVWQEWMVLNVNICVRMGVVMGKRKNECFNKYMY